MFVLLKNMFLDLLFLVFSALGKCVLYYIVNVKIYNKLKLCTFKGVHFFRLKTFLTPSYSFLIHKIRITVF